MKAKAYFSPEKIASTRIRYKGWVLCDECPDDEWGPGTIEDAEGEHLVCGSCWDAGLQGPECPHLKGMEIDEDHQLWIECDSHGWADGGHEP